MSGEVFLGTTQLSIRELDGEVLVPILRRGDLSAGVRIDFATTERAAGADSATSGIDFVGVPGSVVMQPGQDRVLVPVTILNDTAFEATETFVFSIVNVSSQDPARPASALAPRTALIDILDDENPVVDPPDPPLVSNFTVTEQPILSGVSPISFQFAPHNPQLIYIAEKQGTIKVFDLATNAVVATFADLSAKVNSANDRGLLDIALHPDFPNNPYVYVFYVVDPPETQGQFGNAGPDGFGNRFAYVSRLTADVTTNYQTMVPAVKSSWSAGRALR